MADAATAPQQPVEQPVVDDKELVSDFVRTSSCVPKEAKKFLLAELGGPLLHAALEDEQNAAQKSLSETVEEAASTQKELETCEQAVKDTTVAVQQADEDAPLKAAEFQRLQGLAKAASADHVQLRSSTSVQVQGWDDLRNELKETKAVVEEQLPALTSAATVWESDKIKMKAVNAVMTLLTEVSDDKVLLAAAPAALDVAPDARKPFDVVTLGGITESAGEQLKSLSEKLESEAQLERNLRAELLGLWALADCSREDAQEAQGASQESQKDRDRKHSELKLANKRQRSLEDKVQALARTRQIHEDRIAELEMATQATKRLKSAADAAAIAAAAAAAAAAASEVAAAPAAPPVEPVDMAVA